MMKIDDFYAKSGTPYYLQFFGEVFLVFLATLQKSLVAWLFVFVLKKE